MNAAPCLSWTGPDLLPADAAWMARSDLQQTRMLGYQEVTLDSVTGLGLGLMGCQPAVRHVATVSDPILELIALAGHRIEEDTLRYESGEEAHAHARRLIRLGYRLCSPWPLPEGAYRDENLLVPLPLWRRLNGKEHLHELVAPEHLPARQVLGLEAARQLRWSEPLWLKVANEEATGYGYGVRFCETLTAYQSALSELHLLSGAPNFLLETHVPVVRSWCASFSVSDDRTTYLGCAEQLFERPGHQSGSLIDNGRMPTGNVQALVVSIGEKARARGYRGLAGCDLGQAEDGRLVVFDPNFRMNASTSQVVFHGLLAHSGQPVVSRSVNLKTPKPFADLVPLLREWIGAGRFVPTRLLDAALLPAAQGRSFVTGFVVNCGDSSADFLAAAFTSECVADH